MSAMIHELERRLFLSATAVQLSADAAIVAADATATNASLNSLHKGDVAYRLSVAKAIRLVNTKTTRAANNATYRSLLNTDNKQYALVAAAERSLVNLARSYARTAAADGKKLLLHPTDVKLQTKVNKDITLLTGLLTKLTTLENAVLADSTAISPIYTELQAIDPSVSSIVTSYEITGEAATTVFSAAAVKLVNDATTVAVDIGYAPPTLAILTGATLFRGDASGDNQGATSQINYGAWTSGLDVQNIPGNYAAELFISTVANPTPSQFLTPGTLAASLAEGINTFYFFADGDDTNGGSSTFGLNLYIGGSTLSISGNTVPGAGQTLTADSSPTTAAISLAIVPGAGTLSTSSSGHTVTLSSFVVEGVGGQNSTVDLVNSTNTAPFSPPAHADGITDTYGTFQLTVN